MCRSNSQLSSDYVPGDGIVFVRNQHHLSTVQGQPGNEEPRLRPFLSISSLYHVGSRNLGALITLTLPADETSPGITIVCPIRYAFVPRISAFSVRKPKCLNLVMPELSV